MKAYIALFLLALVASAQCQMVPVQPDCATVAIDLIAELKTFAQKGDMSNIMAIMAIVVKGQSALAVCKPAFEKFKTLFVTKILAKSSKNHSSLQGINLNAECGIQMAKAVATIVKIAGSLRVPKNPTAIVAELVRLGQNASAVKKACFK